MGVVRGPNTQPIGSIPSQGQRARVVGYLRAAVGVGLIIAPKAITRLQADKSAAGASVLLVRTIGIRDLLLGAGTVAVAHAAGGAEVRRWVTVGLLSDTLDIVAGAVSESQAGRKGALTAAVVPIPFVLGDLWALARSGPAVSADGRFLPR